MPAQGGKQRKIRMLKSGHGVRPPKRFWLKILQKVRENYPERSDEDQTRITGGIWSGFTETQKIEIVKKYQDRPTGSLRILGRQV